MLIFQILASLFIIFAIFRIISRYYEARIPKAEILVWLIFWLLVSIAVWWPTTTDVLARAVGVSRGVDLFVAASIAIIFYLLFKIFSHLNQMQREMTELVRKIALNNQKDEKED